MANIEVITQINDLLDANDVTIAKTALGVLGAAVKGTGDIVNADINAGAAIADTKLATIATAGKVSNSATTATNANTASTIVARDASGNFTAGTITASLTGTATAVADGAVTTAKILDANVTAGKLAVSAAVGNIVDNTLPLAKLVTTGTTTTHVLSSNGSGSAPTFQALTALGSSVIASVTKEMVCATGAYHGGDLSQTGTGQPSNGTTDLNVTYRSKHWITADCSNLRLLFGNSAQETGGFQDIVVKASLEDASGNFYPVFFNGSRTTTISPKGFVYSDPVGVSFAKGSQIWSRTNVSCAASGKWYKGHIFQLAGEGYVASDYVDTATSFSGGTGYAYAPMHICGDVLTKEPNIAIIGDSISTYDGGQYNNYWAIRGLGSNFGQDYSNVFFGKSGEDSLTFIAPQGRKQRTRLMKGCTHAIVIYAMLHLNNNNSITNLQTIKDNIIAFANTLLKMNIKTYFTTIMPDTQVTSGSWVDGSSQIPAANNTNRIALNDWIRTIPSPLAGYFETADAAETARNSGIWKTGYSTDGLHPSGSASTGGVTNVVTALSTAISSAITSTTFGF